ncbi:MAG: hypothetical protein ACTMKZ_02090 [Brevibacterium aurantiacum]|uniref:Uncharacterized protein n=1 Tax=Brevibacterium aurantiacum TaxID=273384 RepID=A0A2A3Z145_BREAU|nr:hypothetical protein [Brevibacterium aurantiacum]MDN5585584.1 hypothetical protein [Brevibacterium sp.]AZL06810.1 hypothetical protein CXR24_15415 [Brevibacterium aurantiacum]AZL10353.1 hypothetical protein CXR26_14850 [Brevibacterium aurantiacum]AZL14038.1 hypothetical protein CXR25_15350 [Brevibacterium aurantiacum]AZT98360.1 hypothetical protein CXR27_16220 [Brevibacterium aurantiacum]
MIQIIAISLIAYAGIAMFIIILLLSKADYGRSWRDRRDAARMGFFVPVWPLLVLYLIYRAVSRLWHLAEWNMPADRQHR